MVAPRTRDPETGSADAPGASTPGRRSALLPRPERRRRGDLVAAAVLTVLVVVGTLLVLRSGDGAGTDLRTASPPLADPGPAPVPTALVEAWRAASPATGSPQTGPDVVGPTVVTAGTDAGGDGVVTGHDPATGATAWEYRRPETPCTVSSGFGDVLAVFATDSPEGRFCSDVTALDASSGTRGPARNSDVGPGTALVADSSHVLATGADYLELWRSDLVATLEYGALPTPVQADPQPRAGCAHGSDALGSGLVAVLERCAGETSDRLSVLDADPSGADKPTDRLSTLTGIVGGRLVAATPDRTAIAAPDGTLRVLDATGAPVASFPLGPLAGPTTDPPGHTAGVRAAGPVLLWWTGTGTVALDPTDLSPRWQVPGALGPGAALPTDGPTATTVLVPVPGALAVLDAATGAERSRVAVDRRATPVPAGQPVGVDALGSTVVEQRGALVVALRPPR